MFRLSLQTRCRCVYMCSVHVLVRGSGCERVQPLHFKHCALTAGPCRLHDTALLSIICDQPWPCNVEARLRAAFSLCAWRESLASAAWTRQQGTSPWLGLHFTLTTSHPCPSTFPSFSPLTHSHHQHHHHHLLLLLIVLAYGYLRQGLLV